MREELHYLRIGIHGDDLADGAGDVHDYDFDVVFKDRATELESLLPEKIASAYWGLIDKTAWVGLGESEDRAEL